MFRSIYTFCIYFLFFYIIIIRMKFNTKNTSLLLAAFTLPLFAQESSQIDNSDKLKDSVAITTSSLEEASRNQQQINKIDKDTRDLEFEYIDTFKEYENLKLYNDQLQKIINSQLEEIDSILKQIADLDNTNINIIPLMLKMTDSLERFIELDIPFLLDERLERLASIKEVMDRGDISTSEKFRKVADSYEGDRFLMGELHGDDPVSASKSFTATGRLHATYNFNLLEWAGLSVEGIRSAIASAIDAFNGTGRLAFAFSNHDVPRSATRQLDALGLKQDQQEALQLLLLKLEVCLIGSTCIFQGEELACADVQDIPLDLMQDPWGKEFSPVFLGRDTCRTPMVWSKESNSWGDFSTADKTWLPISKEHLERAGIDEMNRPESVYNQFSSFLKWRKTQPAIMAANTMELINSRDHQIIFDRISNNQSLRCCFDFNTLTTSFSEN